MFDLDELTELTESEKDDLARDCGYSQERRVDKIKEDIRATIYDSDEQQAILRKMVKFLYDELNRISLNDYSHNPVVQEFLNYNRDMENIKASHSLGGDTFGV